MIHACLRLTNKSRLLIYHLNTVILSKCLVIIYLQSVAKQLQIWFPYRLIQRVVSGQEQCTHYIVYRRIIFNI